MLTNEPIKRLKDVLDTRNLVTFDGGLLAKSGPETNTKYPNKIIKSTVYAMASLLTSSEMAGQIVRVPSSSSIMTADPKRCAAKTTVPSYEGIAERVLILNVLAGMPVALLKVSAAWSRTRWLGRMWSAMAMDTEKVTAVVLFDASVE